MTHKKIFLNNAHLNAQGNSNLFLNISNCYVKYKMFIKNDNNSFNYSYLMI